MEKKKTGTSKPKLKKGPVASYPKPSMSPGVSTDEESRTVAVGTRFARANTGGIRVSKEHRKYYQRMPRGNTLDQPSITEAQWLYKPSGHEDTDYQSESTGTSSDYCITDKLSSRPAMNWNNTPTTSIRTSLRGEGELGENRLATGFRPRPEGITTNQAPSHDVVVISDDSDMGNDSEGGILLNVEAAVVVDSSNNADTPVETSSGEDGEISDSDLHHNSAKATKQALASTPTSKPTAPPAAQSKSNTNTTPMVQTHARHGGARILADLNPEYLEKQIKYALFHLRRDQIDLSRPVICLACLNEGHEEGSCPGLMCGNCGGEFRHPTPLCPVRRRCASCGERGHDQAHCHAKLRNTELQPCEFCAATDHVEAHCTQRFFPTRSEPPLGELQLWISCAQCGSKDHLAGDCPVYGSKPAHAWSLRTYKRDTVVNLSLQTGAQAREKEALNKGLRPVGLQIKGQAGPNNNSNNNNNNNHKKFGRGGPAPFSSSTFDSDDDFTARIARNSNNNNKSRRRLSPPRTHIRFGNDERDRQNRRDDDEDDNDDRFRPRTRSGLPYKGDTYDPHSLSSDYRDRYSWRPARGYDGGEEREYNNRRLRSRSPPRSGFDGDSYRPEPLRDSRQPHQSLPARPAQQQQQRGQVQQSPRKGRRGGGKGNAGGGVAIKPMPSAAKNAWNKAKF